jgi:hypothetical protein
MQWIEVNSAEFKALSIGVYTFVQYKAFDMRLSPEDHCMLISQ